MSSVALADPNGRLKKKPCNLINSSLGALFDPEFEPKIRQGLTPRCARIEAGFSLGFVGFRYAAAGLRVLPVVVVVVLSAPAWICWPFLPERRQQVVLEMVRALADWTRGAGLPEEITADPAAGPDPLDTGSFGSVGDVFAPSVGEPDGTADAGG
ncbi:hypothetical protein ACFWP2_28925 [Kitasatospora sp. NPDC058444]|uniref:hypothetical protein n=1 Tax=Kitasatospora sp. NPDC058444 TaxID=3346504 RepID=UPI003650357A